MKYILTILVLFSICASSEAQIEKEVAQDKGFSIHFEYEDECGSPLVESQTYRHREGKIIKIIDGETLLFAQKSEDSTKNKKKLIVTLAGIDANTNKDAIENYLAENLLNKNVTVVGNLQSKDSNSLLAVVNQHKPYVDVSRYLLSRGIAKFKSFNSGNLVSYRTPCIYRKQEEEAKKENLGIWAK